MNADELIETRAGLALANAAWSEGASTMLRSVNEHNDHEPWTRPVSPYSQPLLARIKSEGHVVTAPTDEQPPVYLALDLWQALGLPVEEFDGYYDRNGWADTWSNLLDPARRRFGRGECGKDAGGEPCVLTGEHLVHYGASDVGSSEPLPFPTAPSADRDKLRMEDDYQHIYWFDPVEGCWVAYRRADCVGEEELPQGTLATLATVDNRGWSTADRQEALAEAHGRFDGWE